MADHWKQSIDSPGRSASSRDRLVAVLAAGVVAGMLGLSFAAVPLYRIFCQVTGYGGTTQRASRGADVVLDRKIVVRFDANTARDMRWSFKPVQRQVELKIGETGLAFYRAQNRSGKPVTGTATFNVTPAAAGSYFNKIACFCFTEQTLKAGQEVDMPLTFFVDPEITKDPETREIKEITLSYTFFPVAESDKDMARVNKDNMTPANESGG